jgi:putative membrane protein
MMNWSDGMGSGGWALMAVFWMLLIAGMVWAAVLLLRNHSAGPVAVLGPPEILDRRLASGEIDAATYDELRAKLRPAKGRTEPHAH